MQINQQILVFDAPDLRAESSFWSAVLGGTVETYDDSGWHMIKVDGRPSLGIQHVPNHIPPQWPDGTPQQMHVDLWVEDFESAHQEVVSLGAKLLKAADDSNPEEGFGVYADPAGHPFCICFVKKPQPER